MATIVLLYSIRPSALRIVIARLERLQIQNILHPNWLVCTILCLEDHGSGFMADKAVPAARFDGHAAVGSTGGDGHLLGDVAIVIVEILGGTPPKNHHCLCRLTMELSLHKVRQRIGGLRQYRQVTDSRYPSSVRKLPSHETQHPLQMKVMVASQCYLHEH